MTPKEIAALLTGIEYPTRISKEIKAQAKESGIVIIYGASDDLMEFNGAIDDEIGAWQGVVVDVDTIGLIPAFDNIEKDTWDAKGRLRDYFKREGSGKTIEALWCAEEGYSWTYKTDIPHETFEIVEGGEPYCRGIVFFLADAEGSPDAQ